MIVYVTYIQSGVKKKGSMKEEKYQELLGNPAITEVETYPSARLMEQSFKKGDSRQVLLG